MDEKAFSAAGVHLMMTSSPATKHAMSLFFYQKTSGYPALSNMKEIIAMTLNEFPRVVDTACPENVVPKIEALHTV
jgi:hypothetical protein